MKPFELFKAGSLDSALKQAKAGARIKGAGVDLLDLFKEGLVAPVSLPPGGKAPVSLPPGGKAPVSLPPGGKAPVSLPPGGKAPMLRLVDVTSIPGFDSLADHPKKGLTIGATVTLARLADSAEVSKRYPALAQAAGLAATPQLRNRATAGGNICQRPRCWYFRDRRFHCLKKGGGTCFAQKGDNRYHAIFDHDRCAIVHPSALAVALIALDASVQLMRLEGGKKQARDVKLADFFVAPEINVQAETVLQAGEVLVTIGVPAAGAGWTSAYRKQKERQSADWPIAEAAVALQLDGKQCNAARVVLGAAAPTPRRASEAEQVLVGATIDEAKARAAAKAALAPAKPMSGNGWRVPVFEQLLAETILAAAGLAPGGAR